MIIGHVDLSVCKKIIVKTSKTLVIDNNKATISLYENNEKLWESSFKEIKGVCFLQYCLTSSNNLLLVDEVGTQIFRIYLEDGNIKSLFQLNRKENDDDDFYRNEFIIGSGYCLFVYEGGLVKFDVNCNVLWSIEHQYYDWFFKEVKDNLIYYESEYDGVWRYSLITGEKV